MTQGDTESRFMHLLQPIRDLTKNWEIDIASQLEDYLSEIEEIRISFDGGSTSMNFAEAALLIQGSACIYSKKVEYLLALVYQTLNLLASKKKLQQPSSLDEEGRDKDASFAQQKNTEVFLSLDDICNQTSKSFDVREVDLNHNLVKTSQRTPMSLQRVNNLDEDEPLNDAKGEELGKIADFAMKTFDIHRSGTMLLDMSHMSLLEASLSRHPMSTPLPGVQGIGNVNQNHIWPGDAIELPCHSASELPLLPDANTSLDDVEMADVPEDLPLDEQAPDANQMEGRELRPVRIQPKPKVPAVDPWIALDPHEAKSLPEKSFKKGKPFKIPASLSRNTRKRKRKGAPEKPTSQPLTPISQFITNAYYSHTSKLPNSALKRPLFPEFDNLYYVEFKRQQAARRREKEVLAKEGRFEELLEREEEENDLYNDAPEVDEGDFGGTEPDDDGGGGGMEDVVNDAGPVNTSGADFPSTQEIITSYEELVRQHVEAYMLSAQQYTQVTELGKRVQAWEDRITPILHREERYGFFDIHEYGSIVLNRLEEVEQREGRTKQDVPFSQVVANYHAHDISRLFLATLQLANTYNVEIGNTGIENSAMDTLSLKLLNKRRHNEALHDYRAPSLVN